MGIYDKQRFTKKEAINHLLANCSDDYAYLIKYVIKPAITRTTDQFGNKSFNKKIIEEFTKLIGSNDGCFTSLLENQMTTKYPKVTKELKKLIKKKKLDGVHNLRICILGEFSSKLAYNVLYISGLENTFDVEICVDGIWYAVGCSHVK